MTTKYTIKKTAVVCICLLLVLGIWQTLHDISNDVRNLNKQDQLDRIRSKFHADPTASADGVAEFSAGGVDDAPLSPLAADAKETRAAANGQGIEQRHVALLKVHKTGSSSIQNIFLRFGESRNLTFILAHDDEDIAETAWPNVISYKNTLLQSNIVPPPVGRQYDLVCCHVIYNRSQFHKYLPMDTKYVGIVRDPITRLESAIRYFGMYPNVNLSSFALDPLLYDKQLPSMSNNRMAFEFGFPLELFPRNNVTALSVHLQETIYLYIQQLKTDFDLIIVNERMDESLVLMKRSLGWNIKDILYQRTNVAKRETRKFSEQDIRRLKPYLYLDYALYTHAVEQLERKIVNSGDDFMGEVARFKGVIESVTHFCTDDMFGSMTFERSNWDAPFTVTIDDCKAYSKGEVKFIQDIRMKMYGHLNM